MARGSRWRLALEFVALAQAQAAAGWPNADGSIGSTEVTKPNFSFNRDAWLLLGAIGYSYSVAGSTHSGQSRREFPTQPAAGPNRDRERPVRRMSDDITLAGPISEHSTCNIALDWRRRHRPVNLKRCHRCLNCPAASGYKSSRRGPSRYGRKVIWHDAAVPFTGGAPQLGAIPTPSLPYILETEHHRAFCLLLRDLCLDGRDRLVAEHAG